MWGALMSFVASLEPACLVACDLAWNKVYLNRLGPSFVARSSALACRARVAHSTLWAADEGDAWSWVCLLVVVLCVRHLSPGAFPLPDNFVPGGRLCVSTASRRSSRFSPLRGRDGNVLSELMRSGRLPCFLVTSAVTAHVASAQWLGASVPHALTWRSTSISPCTMLRPQVGGLASCASCTSLQGSVCGGLHGSLLEQSGG